MTTKSTEMARVSAKGGFHLLWGLVASTLISAVGTIIIAGLLGADNYGLYAVALAAPNLIANFRDWGINTAIIKYSAQYNSENNVAKIRSVFVSGLLFEIVLGLLLSLFSFTLSGFLATIFNRPAITALIQIASFFILIGGLINAATAAFTGMETMHLNSIMLIVQSIVKTALIVTLVLFGLGTLGAVTGFTYASLIAGLTGIFLMFTIYKSFPKPTSSKIEIIATTKTMFKYGLPISIGGILTGFLVQFYSWIMAIYVSNNAIIGNYTVALNFVVLITFFSLPVTTMLFPAFSKLDAQKDQALFKNVFQYSVKYASVIVVPITTMVMALAQPGIGTIFANRYVDAPLFLVLSSITYLYTALGSLSAGNLINGQGYTTFNLKMSVLTAAIGFPLSFILISKFGVIGLIVTSLVVSLPSLFLSLRFIKMHFGVSVDWVSSGKILFSSGLAAIVSYVLLSQLAFSNPIKLIIGLITFVIVFIATAIVTRTVNKSDLTNLREISNGLGILRKPLNSIINLLEKLIKILHAENQKQVTE
ncbi:MAG: oligosaccharide flippase family protein [Candidatus Bathyarchaeia archaeon]|jgi:O-antigen/teichoic acid export membrane protein